MSKRKYTFIDLFAGIGGFHTAMHSVGARCVFASEWDKNARLSYEANYIINDISTRDTYILFEGEQWRAWGITYLEDDGYIHVLELVYAENIDGFNIRYEGDNNVINEHYEGWRLYANITLTNHKNYNDFAMVWELGYNLYDSPFTYMAIDGVEVDFDTFITQQFAQVGTVVTFSLKSGYEVPAGRDYIVNDNGVYTMEIKYSTINKYYLEVATREYFEGSDTEFVYEHVIGVDIIPYILSEIEVDGNVCDTREKYGHRIDLSYQQENIIVDFNRDDFEKFDLYYTIQKLDGSYETFEINSLPLSIPNAKNIQNFTICCRNNGQDEIVQTFDIEQFTPIEEYVINKEYFSGSYTETFDHYIDGIHASCGIVTNVIVNMKEGYNICDDHNPVALVMERIC